ncbi:hypothetical protein BDA99DRAFT_501656 [Phascolomyces articulosus]|uniref:DNA 5'-3' helicase n=1 Tax=Phascolomyces articulosus TaxID=60185 RepID=A0AAD5K5C3_9FUNG|nr:hypothetical protein BDA99DRAFT_501656 [Phascolomyces articulosus]
MSNRRSRTTTRKRRGNKNDLDEEQQQQQQQTLPYKTLAQMRKSVKRSSDSPMKTYPMSGIPVEFPFQPYPAQIQMMSKIVKALKEKKNALLESPTGSGKSLAILCASLAWSEYERKQQLEEAEKVRLEKEAEVAAVAAATPADVIVLDDDCTPASSSTPSYSNTTNPHLKRGFSEDDDFKPVKLPTKLLKIEEERRSKSKSPEVSIDGEDNGDDTKTKEEDVKPFIRVSKIYVGSRTHKQLSQLIGELKSNTRYRPRMSVLGSRDQYCIHGKVKKVQDKGEACTQLLDDGLCSYANRIKNILTEPSIRPGGINEIWDIEDLTQLGKKKGGCPYFSARTLADTAHIIFCPYNYLLDPLVRSSLELDLTDSVIILDEAHNIEDAARSSGSFELTEVQLRIVAIELVQVSRHPKVEINPNLSGAYNSLFAIVENLQRFMDDDFAKPTIKRDNYEEHISIWNNKDILSKLSELDISQGTLKSIVSAYETVADQIANLKKDKEDKQRDNPEDDNYMHDIHETRASQEEKSETEIKRARLCISIKSLRLFEGLVMILKFLISEEATREKDYSMALIKKVDRRNTYSTTASDWEIKLAFWCLNPAIIFRDMAKDARSVVLTSGTLSPLNTFASELETNFPIRLEANHVIDRSQVWIRSIVQGPGAVTFHGTWERASQFQYQDAVGQSLCEISETIPYGILCFVPSYNAMEKLMDRWNTTGVYDRLEQRKYILCEPTGKNSKDLFERLMDKYYYYINEAESRPHVEGQKDGAILFAVYRGKVSEGIDFTDNNCRAVIALGIPFPNIKDVQVELKKDYNTKRYNSGEPVLNGGGWYRTQAYRAINQALGRCIRHRRVSNRFCFLSCYKCIIYLRSIHKNLR